MNSESDIDTFIKLLIQIEEFLEGFIELSKKKPNDAVNKFKLKFINNLLTTSNEIIDVKNKPFEEFESFNEDELPTNSDVVLILSQYVACLKKFGRESSQYYNHVRYWTINGERTKRSVNNEFLN